MPSAIKEKLFPSLDLVDRDRPAGELPDRLWPFVWYFVGQVKGPVLLMFITCLAANVLLSLEPWFFGQFAEVLKNSLSEEISSGWKSLSVLLVAYLALVQFGSRILYTFVGGVNARFMMPFVMMVRRQLGQYMYGHSYRYFQDDYVGRLAGKVMEMPDALRNLITQLCYHLNFCIMQFVVAIVFFMVTGWDFGLLALGYAIGAGAVVWWAVKYIGPASYQSFEDMNEVRGRYIDSISNMYLVKVFARRSQEDALMRKSLGKAATSAQRKNKLVWAQETLQHLCNAAFQIALVFLVFDRFRSGEVALSDVVMMLTFGAVVTANSWWLAQLVMEFVQILEEIRNSLDTIIQRYEVVDRPQAKELQVEKGHVTLSGLVFSYPSCPVFDGLSLDMRAGEKVGLVGPSGAGKSTLVQLILRLYDVQGGSISIDGQDITDVTQDSLRKQIAVIPQSSELLHRSVLDNIRFGNEDASFDAVVNAAKLAHADGFIRALEDKEGKTGYDAEVGERGVKLSGGQRQRIALARAILKDAPILVLDEATSALDSESEKLIEKSLVTVMEGRTVLAIAHRLSTLRSMDRLIVLDQGKIVETGRHDDLLAQGGLYARLWTLQTSGHI